MFYDSVNIMPNKENVSKLLEVLDLVLSKCKRKSNLQDLYGLDQAKYKKSTNLSKKSSKIVSDCLGNHRFNDAAKFLWVMCQDRDRFDTLLYKAIMVVLENIEVQDKDETVLKFSCDIQERGMHPFIKRQDVHLEYIIYALRNNIPDIQSLHQKVKHKNTLWKKMPGIDQVLIAYIALLDYKAWRDCCQDDLVSTDTKIYADKAIHGFKSIIKYPGTWDIFIIRLIEMLEHYEKYKEIEDILKKYIKCNPEHINAYIYFCVHLHKYNKDSELFIQYAKVLAKLCPSDVRVLLLVQVWDKLGRNLKKCLKILFMFLDYPINGNNVLGWQMLSSHLSEAMSQSSKVEFIKSEWELREHVWRNMHFNLSNISSGFEDNFELMACKVEVLTVLQPDHEYIQEASKRIPQLSNSIHPTMDM